MQNLHYYWSDKHNMAAIASVSLHGIYVILSRFFLDKSDSLGKT